MPAKRNTSAVTDAVLMIVGGSDGLLTDQIVLDRLPVRIGRGRRNDLVLAHPLVSRVHCELFEQDGKLAVRDLDSLNGTFVGNRPVRECILNPGDLLTVGTVTFRAVYGGFDFETALDGVSEELNDARGAVDGIDDAASILDTVPTVVDAGTTLIQSPGVSVPGLIGAPAPNMANRLPRHAR